ncbi:hypothetical protein ACF0H5_003220 [Mactra antiquata]
METNTCHFITDGLIPLDGIVVFDWDNTLKIYDHRSRKISSRVPKEDLQRWKVKKHCEMFIISAIRPSRMNLETLLFEVSKVGLTELFIAESDEIEIVAGKYARKGNIVICGYDKAETFLSIVNVSNPTYLDDVEVDGVDCVDAIVPTRSFSSGAVERNEDISVDCVDGYDYTSCNHSDKSVIFFDDEEVNVTNFKALVPGSKCYLKWIANKRVWFVNGDIQNSTHVTLCAAQCEALCLDGVADCENKCGGARQWITTCDADCELDCNRASPLNNNICDKSTCRSTCSALSQYTQTDKCHVLHPPNVTIVTIDPSTIELSWSRPSELIPSSMSPLTAIYIVEETHNHPQWTAVTSTAFKPWSTGTRFRVNITDVCNLDQYRVIAINRFGSTGFSSPARLPGLKPGDIRNIRYAGSGVYYYKNQDYPDQSQFMAILQWDIPAGWKASDIDHYEWNPMVRRHCSDTNKDSLPVFTSMKNRKNHILMTMASSSFDCTFKAEVRAVSRCNMYGDWTQFNVDLTNCSSIIGYRCAAESVISPDNVQNVNLSISATNVEQLAEIFTNKTLLLSNHIHSPLLINLHINWRPPVYKGSLGVIHHYMIRSGTVKMNLFPLPPIFNEPVKTINVSNDIVQLTFELHTDNIPYIFGVQVIAVGPGQVIEENDWGLFKIYTIEVSRNNTGIAQLKQEGKVLLDESGIVIVYINNSIPVYFLFDSPSARMDNNTIDRYAVQWGPLVGPHDKMQIENNTILPVAPKLYDDGIVPAIG